MILGEQADNEAICEKLLGWVKVPLIKPIPGIEFAHWKKPDGFPESTPSFTTWAEAGLILDAFEAIHSQDFPNATKRSILFERDVTKHASMPVAIRAAALEYIYEAMVEEATENSK